MSDDIRPEDEHPDDIVPDPGSASALPPELADLLRQFTGGVDLPPEVMEQFAAMGLGNVPVGQFEQLLTQVQSMFSGPDEGPVSATVAADVSRKMISATGDPSMSDREGRLAREAAHVADLWLGAVTSLEAPGLRGVAWSRSEWVLDTMPVWQELVTPVAEGVTRAMSAALMEQFGSADLSDLPPGLVPPGTNPAAMMAQLAPMLSRVGASMFSIQLGQALAALAGETLTGTEVALPITSEDTLALLPANIATFAEGLEVDTEQVWLYLAVREAARLRLFAGAAWLGPQLLTAVQDYARGIDIDTEAISSALREADATDPAALQAMLTDRLFTPSPTPAQQAALSRLETWLALIEGWVDVVTERATGRHLPQAEALGETVRRRRALGGPAEKTFAGLVGLDLRPRRLRDAANLWSALEAAGGADLRDACWGHPDLAPTAADLDDVLGYVDRRTSAPAADDNFDAELAQLLGEET